MVVVAVSFAACAFMGLAFSLYIVAGRKNQAAHRNMRDLCILPFFGRLPEICNGDVTARKMSGPTRQSAPGILAKIVPYKLAVPRQFTPLASQTARSFLSNVKSVAALRRVTMK